MLPTLTTLVGRLRIALLFTAIVASLWLADEREAHAFCGFYVSGADTKLFNDATQVVLMREGTRTVLSMQNAYKGPPESFAMVVPVPVVLQKANVKTLKKELFEKLDQQSAPRLVEYWEEDPCATQKNEEMVEKAASGGKGGGPALDLAKKDLGVKIEAQFTVGEYEIVILSAQDASGLDTWLKRERYKIPDGAEPYFRPYVQSGSKFFVARVDVKKVRFDAEGRADLSPLRFHYDSTELTLPVRLGLINSAGTQDLIVHVLARGQRYEPANYPSVTIPTNLDVTSGAKEKFGSFYAALFDRTLEKNPKAIVTEYAWDASTCDPCPGPTLDGSDIQSLGADAIPSPANAPPSAGKSWNGGRGGAGGWVLTRLHARYSKESLGQDIVFKAAPPIAGGREMIGPNGQLEHGPQSSPVNNFQGRYAIRHPWTGEVACTNPRRGIWGGPPNGSDALPTPRPATRTAFASRNVPLAQLVTKDIPEIDVKASGERSSETPLPASSTPPPPPAPTPAVPEAPKKSGCAGCTTARTSPFDDVIVIALSMIALGAFSLRRRRAR